MIEYFFGLLDKFAAYILGLLDTELMHLKPIDVLVMAAFMVGVYFFVKVLVKAFFKYGGQGAVAIYKPINKMTVKAVKHNKSKRVCHVCKNPLHNCTCASNRGVSYKKRLKKWKKVQKANNKRKKPVELKIKRKNGGR